MAVPGLLPEDGCPRIALESFADLEAARLSVFKYIETFYNSVRLHQALGYKSPNQFETEYAPVLAA